MFNFLYLLYIFSVNVLLISSWIGSLVLTKNKAKSEHALSKFSLASLQTSFLPPNSCCCCYESICVVMFYCGLLPVPCVCVAVAMIEWLPAFRAHTCHMLVLSARTPEQLDMGMNIRIILKTRSCIIRPHGTDGSMQATQRTLNYDDNWQLILRSHIKVLYFRGAKFIQRN